MREEMVGSIGSRLGESPEGQRGDGRQACAVYQFCLCAGEWVGNICSRLGEAPEGRGAWSAIVAGFVVHLLSVERGVREGESV